MRETLKAAAFERLKREFEALRLEGERLREWPHDREAHRKLRERLDESASSQSRGLLDGGPPFPRLCRPDHITPRTPVLL